MVESATLRITLLGGFAVQVGTQQIPATEWRRRNAAYLVKLLALARTHRLHREEVVDALWPGLPPAAAANNLHQTLHNARKVLEPDRPVGRAPSFLELHRGLIDLSPSAPVEVDVDGFRSAAASARCRRDPEAYEAALARYSGDLLPEDRFDDWAARPREDLRTLWLVLLIELARLRGVCGESHSAIEAYRRVIAADPTHEEAQTELIRRYAARGQRAQAVRQFQQFRESLRRELGIGPPRAVEQLVRGLLDGGYDEIPADRTRPNAPPRSDANVRPDSFAPGHD